jgi:hypothetical protein
MMSTEHRRRLLRLSGCLIKAFLYGFASFSVVLIVYSLFGGMLPAALLLMSTGRFWLRLMVVILCFVFIAVFFESFS